MSRETESLCKQCAKHWPEQVVGRIHWCPCGDVESLAVEPFRRSDDALGEDAVISAVGALFASGATGWFLAKLYARPTKLTTADLIHDLTGLLLVLVRDRAGQFGLVTALLEERVCQLDQREAFLR